MQDKCHRANFMAHILKASESYCTHMECDVTTNCGARAAYPKCTTLRRIDAFLRNLI